MSLIITQDDGSLFNGLQSIDEWQTYFNYPSSNTLGLMNSSGFLSGIVASFFGDTVQRFVGKRMTLWISTVMAVSFDVLYPLSLFCFDICVTPTNVTTI